MKVKRKGAYQYEDLGWHQDQGGLVIPKAAEAFMIHGTPIEEFIKNHKDIFDFMLRVKVPRNSRLVLVQEDGTEKPEQNICRFYASTKGGNLVKIMPPLPDDEEQKERRLSVGANQLVKTCNNMKDFGNDIDYEYYIKEAEKLASLVETGLDKEDDDE